MTVLEQEMIISAVRERYGVGESFARAFLDYWQGGYEKPFASLDEILDLPAPQPVWFNFAMSANQRGQQTYQALAPHLPPGARRYLDIGCGYGGSLVAFARAGFEVLGIDIDDLLLGFARANCQDHGLGEPALHASILDDGLPVRLGSFDVITLLAVIEHVPDVLQTLKNALDLLAPGGILVLDIPNKDSLEFVVHDPHYDLFGLTLLERPEAQAYFEEFFTVEYNVGDFDELDVYQGHLRACGYDSRLINLASAPPGRLRSLPRRLMSLGRGYIDFLARTDGRLEKSLRRAVQRRLVRYLLTLGADLFRQPLVPSDERSFQLKYLTSIWTLMAYNRATAGIS